MFNLQNAKKLPVVFEKSRESEESGAENNEYNFMRYEKYSTYSADTRSIKSSLTSASFPRRQNAKELYLTNSSV